MIVLFTDAEHKLDAGFDLLLNENVEFISVNDLTGCE